MSLKDTSSCSLNYILMHAVQRSESLNSERGYCSYKTPLSLAAEVGKHMLSRIWDKRIRTDGTVITAIEYCLVLNSSSLNPSLLQVLSFLCLLSWCPTWHILGLICRSATIKSLTIKSARAAMCFLSIINHTYWFRY